MNVLVVDDSATIRRRLVEKLSTLEGVERVDAVASALDASRAIHSIRLDVVVRHPKLPGDGGIEALEVSRAASQQPTTIVLTNHTTPRWRETCLRVGADFFFDKAAEVQRAIDVIAGLALGRAAQRPPSTRVVLTLRRNRFEGNVMGGYR